MDFSPATIIFILLTALAAHLWGATVLAVIATGAATGLSISNYSLNSDKFSHTNTSTSTRSSHQELAADQYQAESAAVSVSVPVPVCSSTSASSAHRQQLHSNTSTSSTASASLPDPSSLFVSSAAPFVSANSASISNEFSHSSSSRLILVAQTIPITVTINSDGSLSDSVSWADTRSFLANLRRLKSDERKVYWVGLCQPEFLLGSAVSSATRQRYLSLCRSHDCYPVFVESELFDSYLTGFCKKVLWPLLHYSTQQTMKIGEEWPRIWNSYQKVNELIASEVTRLMSPAAVDADSDDLVWVHNYFCFLVPSFIRLTQPRAKLGLFIHTTFPSSDLFRILPSRAHILSSIMCVDLLGFHTFDYARHFLSCIKRVLDLDFETITGGTLGVKVHGRFVSILISHVGINSQAFKESLGDEKTIAAAGALKARYAGKQIIVSVGELDYIKGPQLKLHAYERFLSKYPTLKDKIVFIEVLQFSKNAIDCEAVRTSVAKQIEAIKIKFGDEIIQVVEPTASSQFDFCDLVALYNSSSVAVASSLYDGLNLMPFEFTASQNPNEPGVLILSEFMGCSRSLNGVIRVNPFALDDVADKLYFALQMPIDERKANHLRRFNYVMQHNVDRWALEFIEKLEKAAKPTAELNFVQTNQGNEIVLMGLRGNFIEIDNKKLKAKFQLAEQRILFIDYDGTLTNSEKSDQRAELARPNEEIMETLRLLTSDQRNCVFIMSGRGRATLAQWFDCIPELGLAAEKGLFIRWPNRLARRCRKNRVNQRGIESEESFADRNSFEEENANKPARTIREQANAMDKCSEAEWEYMVRLSDVSWKQSAMEIVENYTEQTDGSWIEDKEFGIVWHYENVDPEYGRMQTNDLHKHLVKVLSHPDVEVVKYNNSRILEVKPRGVSKGNAAIAICEGLFVGVNSPFQFARQNCFLCVGDDNSDESMFQAIQSVGPSIQIIAEANSNDSAIDPQAIQRIINSISSSVSDLNSAAVRSMKAQVDRGEGFLRDDNLFTATVGMKPSAAKYFIKSHVQVIELLKELTK